MFVIIANTMKLSRVIFLPLLLALALLFAQQAGVSHALHHALEHLSQQQEDKQAPHSYTCEKCAEYAQLGSALNVGIHDFNLLPVSDATVQHRSISLCSVDILAAVARGPPLTNNNA